MKFAHHSHYMGMNLISLGLWYCYCLHRIMYWFGWWSINTQI